MLKFSQFLSEQPEVALTPDSEEENDLSFDRDLADFDLGDDVDTSEDDDDVDNNEDGDEGDDITPTEDDPDRQGQIRTVAKAHLVYKRADAEGTFEELWIYNIDNNIDEYSIRKAILAGTDIKLPDLTSEDGLQTFSVWIAGNAELLNITGLPS